MYFLGASLGSLLIMLAVFLLIIAGLVKWFRDLIYILTHLKLFKHFFSQPFKGKAPFQFFIIIVFLCLLGLEVFVLPFALQSHSCSGVNVNNYRSRLKKAVAGINQALTMNYALEGKIDVDSIEDFSSMFARRFNTSLSNFEYPTENERYHKMEFSDDFIRQCNLDEYINKPMFMSNDGMYYVIDKFTQGCKFVDEENPDNSDCIIVVDVNAQIEPNKMTTDKNNPQDRYKIVVYGEEIKAVPLHKAHRVVLYDINDGEFQGDENGR